MKTNKIINGTIILSLCAALAFALSSCASNPNNKSGVLNKVRDFIWTPTVVASSPVTNYVPVYTTNVIIVPPVTNLQTGVVTPPIVTPGAQPTGIDTVIVQPPPGYQWSNGQWVSTAQAVASTVPGWGSVIALGIGLLTSIGKGWLNRKQADGFKSVSVSTFQAIEDFANAAIASGDPKAMALAAKLKEMLAKAHDYADVNPIVEALIEQYTGFSGSSADVAAIAKKPATTTASL